MWVKKSPEEISSENQQWSARERSPRTHIINLAVLISITVVVVVSIQLTTTPDKTFSGRGEDVARSWSWVVDHLGTTVAWCATAWVVAYGIQRLFSGKGSRASKSRTQFCPACDKAVDAASGATCDCGRSYENLSDWKWIDGKG